MVLFNTTFLDSVCLHELIDLISLKIFSITGYPAIHLFELAIFTLLMTSCLTIFSWQF